MNKIFSDSLKNLEKVLSNQKLENQARFYVSFEFMLMVGRDVFGPYRDFTIFEEFSNEVTEFTIKNWVEQIETKYSGLSRNCKEVTILFFKEIS